MTTLLLGTRKGLIVYEKIGNDWKLAATHFIGIPVSMVLTNNLDWWAFLDHGHWGVKIHHSSNKGGSWRELQAPVYPKGEEVKDGIPANLRYIWAAAQAENKVWLGTDPGGLFETSDAGETFRLNRGLWDHSSRKEGWFGGGRDQPGIHSVCIDPRDKDHIYIAISCAGVFETKDGGQTWCPKNKGLKADFLPDPNAEIGQDPHLLVMSQSNPDVLWQQNHCGIFRTTNGGESWDDVTDYDGVANFGFTIVSHPENEQQAWVVPGVSDGVRVAVDQKLQVCRTDDGGNTWKSFSKGLPQEGCYDIVYRHCMDFNGSEMVFGTTTGNLFVSSDLGESWDCISNYLPMVYCVHFTK